MNPFEELIKELGQKMGTPLHVDSYQACTLLLNYGLKCQIELTAMGDSVLIGTELGGVPAGRYRQNILTQALRVNALTDLPRGVLAFSEKNDSLVLFEQISLAILSGEKLYRYLLLFTEHAKVWRDSLHRGEIPAIEGDDAKLGFR